LLRAGWLKTETARAHMSAIVSRTCTEVVSMWTAINRTDADSCLLEPVYVNSEAGKLGLGKLGSGKVSRWFRAGR